MLLLYEKLPLMCLNCGMIGHLVHECSTLVMRVLMVNASCWRYSCWFETQRLSAQQPYNHNSPLPKRMSESVDTETSNGGSDKILEVIKAFAVVLHSSKSSEALLHKGVHSMSFDTTGEDVATIEVRVEQSQTTKEREDSAIGTNQAPTIGSVLLVGAEKEFIEEMAIQELSQQKISGLGAAQGVDNIGFGLDSLVPWFFRLVRVLLKQS